MVKTINNEFRFEYPDDFEALNEDDLKKMFGEGRFEGFGIRNTEKHIVIAIFRAKAGGLLGALTDAKGVSDNRRIRAKVMYQDFKELDNFSTQLCGKEAFGYTFAYKAGEIAQVGEILTVKHNKSMYSIHYYAREESHLFSHLIFDKILESIVLE